MLAKPLLHRHRPPFIWLEDVFDTTFKKEIEFKVINHQ